MKTCNVIEDGYTRRAHIKAEPGIHQGLTFEYRPMLAEKVEDLDAAVQRAKPEEKIRIIAMALAGGNGLPGQLVSWSEVDAKGAERPVSYDAVRRFPYLLLADVKRIVIGVWAGDPLPDATDEEESEFARAVRLQAEGKAPGLEQQAADRKN